jgi:WD40 repeat protein
MGVVYEVRDPRFPERRLALKQILAAGATPEEVLRFEREGQLLAQLDHPGVVRVHALDRSPTGPYLVTDLVPGESLQERLRRGPLPDDEAAALTARVARALAAVHERGILHRDLKPHNVMLRPDGSPVLIDFGVARGADSERLTQTGMIVGTPAYASPEQVDGAQALDARSDVYGLGAILFACLSGRPPHEGSGIQLLKRVLQAEPRWPSADREVDAALEAICRRALAKDAADRSASAVEVADSLEAWSAGARAEGGGWRGRAAAGGALLVLAGAIAAIALPGAPATQDRQPLAGKPLPESDTLPAAPTDPGDVAPTLPPLPAELRPPRPLDGPKVHRLAYLADGRLAVAARKESAFFVLTEDQEPLRWTLGADPSALVVRGDEALVGVWRSLGRVDPGLGPGRVRPFANPPPGPVFDLAWSDAGSALLATEGGVYRLDPADGQTELVDRHDQDVRAVALSDDGLYGAATSGQKRDAALRGPLRVYDLSREPRLLHEVELPKTQGLAFDPTGTRLAVGTNEGMVFVLDVATGRQVDCVDPAIHAASRNAHFSAVAAVAWSPDGRVLYSLTGDRKKRPDELAAWDAHTGELLDKAPVEGPEKPEHPTDLAVSPDGRTVAVGRSVPGLFLFAGVRSPAPLSPEPPTAPDFTHALPGEVWGILRSSEGRILAARHRLDERGSTQEAALELVDPRRQGKVLWSVRYPPRNSIHGLVRAADGSFGLIGVGTRVERFSFPLGDREPARTLVGDELPKPVTALALASDGRTCAVGANELLLLGDAQAGGWRPMGDRSDRWVWGLAFSADGAYLAAGRGGNYAVADRLRIYRVADGQVVRELRTGHRCRALAWSPEGHRLAWGNDLGRAGVFGLAEDDDVTFVAPQGLGVERAHEGSVRGVAFSPDGEWVLTVRGEDTEPHYEVAVWEASTGAERTRATRLQATNDAPPISLSLDVDGQRYLLGFARGGGVAEWRAHWPQATMGQ